MNKKISLNIKIHDAIARKYEKEHFEIYNDFEQKRLKNSLIRASHEIKTNADDILAMDFGCGAGNLTQHLLDLNMSVTAADVSDNFLELIRYKFNRKYESKLSILKLNGENISNVNDNTFDFIATYSVLHHIPDYLSIIKEFARVLRSGGVLYIDHESSPGVWKETRELSEYENFHKKEILRATKLARFGHLFLISYWKNAFKEFLDPKFKPEGDIHVFKDDHIEWDEIENVLRENKMEIILTEDYLLRTKYCSDNLYNSYKNKCFNTRLLIARKK